MSKLIWAISFLIIADLLFISTGQLCASGTCSLTSIVFEAVLDLNNFDAGTFFSSLIGNISDLFNSEAGLASLIAAGAVIVGTFFVRPQDSILFIPLALTFALLASDFVIIFGYLASFNFILATFIMAPIIIIYIVAVIEWLRGFG